MKVARTRGRPAKARDARRDEVYEYLYALRRNSPGNPYEPVYAPLRQIQEALHISQRSLLACLDTLEHDDLIAIDRGRSQTPNAYWVRPPREEEPR